IGAGGNNYIPNYIIHQPVDDLRAPFIWRYDGTGETGDRVDRVAIKFLPLTEGQISFGLPWDQQNPEEQVAHDSPEWQQENIDDQEGGMEGEDAHDSPEEQQESIQYVQSLPNGFVLRQLPYDSTSDDDDWWRVKITGNDQGVFAFAAIVVSPNGTVTTTIEVIPSSPKLNDDNIEEPPHNEATAEEIYRNAVEGNDAATLRRLLSCVSDTQREELLRTAFEDLDGSGRTALHIAANMGYTAVARTLLANGVEVNKPRDGDKQTALHFAARYGKNDIVRMLLDKDADVNAQDGFNWTALHIAAKFNHIAVIEALLDGSIDPGLIASQLNAQNKFGLTALHHAVTSGNVAIVRLLLDRGAPVDAQDVNGYTPLHVVVYLKALPGDNDGSRRQQRGTDITQALLAKLQEQGTNIQATLGNDTLKDKEDTLAKWEAEVQKPGNEWYRQALQGYGIEDILRKEGWAWRATKWALKKAKGILSGNEP
ncbi:MAG: ankyrin repeat domain-containing protein, partial [Puniceicoccales bacterium]|nr:ankyrin repeat domain-containing protein [Puniceicoccales bacterium]